MWKRHSALIVIWLVVFSNILIFLPPDDLSPIGSAAAAPPAIEDDITYWDGNWVVNNNATYQNQTIIVNGNLIVTELSSLTLINVTIKMNGTGNLSRFIQVNDTGSLIIKDYDNNPLTPDDGCNITSNHTDGQHRFGFNVTAGSNFSMINSKFSESGRPAGVSRDWGLYIRTDNAVVRNCEIYNCYAGIIVASCAGTNIENNTFSNILSYGMYLPGADDLFIYNNTIDMLYDNSDGIWLTSGQRNSIVGNKITCYGTLSYCIFLSPSCKWTDIISNYMNCSKPNTRCIYVQSDYVNITSNNLIGWDSNYIIDLENVNWIDIKDNILQGDDVISVISFDGSSNITVTGGSIKGIDCRTILINNGARDIIFDGVSFSNAATTNEIIGFIGAKNVTLVNCTFNAQDEDLYLYGNSEVTIRNSNYKTVGFSDTLSTLTEQHYLDLIIVDHLGNPIPGANVQIKNKTNSLVFENKSDANGWIQCISLTEGVHNKSTSDLHTPHNITITASGYKTWYSDIIMDQSKLIGIILLKPGDKQIIHYASDWDVVGTEEYWNQTFLMDGNITVDNGETLILHNCTILMNCSQLNGQYHISVLNGGTLRILDYDWDNSTPSDETLITDSPFDVDNGSAMDFAYNFTTDQGGLLEIRNSSIRDCGWLPDPLQPWINLWEQGVWIDADNAILDHVNITNRYKGIIISWTSDVTVANCTININASDLEAIGILTYDSVRTQLLDTNIKMGGTGANQTGILQNNNIDNMVFGNYVNMQSTNGWADGISVINGGNNNWIMANTVEQNIDGSGIILWNTDSVTIAFNTIHTYAGYSSAIHLGGGGATNCNIQHNNITLYGINRGLDIRDDCQNTVINNITIFGAGDYIEAIAVNNAYNNFTISNANINLTGNYSTGLFSDQSSYFSVFGLNVTPSGLYSSGISLLNSNNIMISGVKISTSSSADDAFGAWVEHSDNIMIGDFVANMQNNGGSGMWFHDGASNCYVMQANITTSGIANEALVGFNCSSVVLLNSSLSASQQDDIVLAQGAIIALINTTYSDRTVVNPSSSLFVFWYLHVKVVDEFGQAFSDVNVEVQRADTFVIYNGVTDNNGWAKWILCMGHLNTSSGIDNSSNPYTIRVYNATCWDETTADMSWTGQTVIIKLLNEDPIITNPLSNIMIQEDTSRTWDFNTTDHENNPIVWSINTTSGWIDLNSSTGELTLSPNEMHVGNHYLKIRATDINNGYLEFDITVNVLNRAPLVQTTIIPAATEDLLYNLDLNSDDDPKTTWTLSSGPSWLSIASNNGTISGTPNNLHVGISDVELFIEDSHGGVTWYNFSISVNNNPPMITTNDYGIAYEDQTYSVDYFSTDDGYGTITWSLISSPSWLKIHSVTGVLSGTPSNLDIGQSSVTIEVSDGNGGVDRNTFSLLVINTPPTILTQDVIWVDEDSTYEVDYSSSDDGQGAIVWSLETNANAWLKLDSNTGLLSGSPINEHVGIYWVNIIVEDGHAGVTSHNFTLTVNNTNDAPVIVTQDGLAAIEDQLYFVAYDAADDDKDILTWTLVTEATWLMLDPDSGELSGTPTNLDVGIWELTVTCDDGHGGVASHIFNITVLNVNDDPIINLYSPSDNYPSVEEGETLEFNVTYSDEDNDKFYIEWTLDGGTVREDVPFWIYRPEFGTAGDHEIIINITDNGGASVSQRWIVIVTAANRAPIINVYSPMNLKPIITSESSSMSFSINATDPDSDPLIYKWFIDEEDTGERTSSFTLARSLYRPGAYNLTVQVTDPDGASADLTWIVNVQPEPDKKDSSVNDTLPIIILVVVIIVVVLILVFLFMKKKKQPVTEIEDIFLISDAGILLAHRSKELRPDVDDSILSGMLTAIQDFITDAFKDKTKFGLRRLDFGDSMIHLKRGNGFYLAVVLMGEEPPELENKLNNTIDKIEAEYGEILENWKGNLNQVRGIKDQLDDLIK